MTDPLRSRWGALADELAESWAARATDNDRSDQFPAADIEDLRDSGLLRLLVPERLGGMGGSFADYSDVAMRLGAASGSSALLFNMHACVTGALAGVPDDIALALGVPEVFFTGRDDILRRAAAGAMYGVAISERKSGSRLSAIRTTYVREDGGFRLRGNKSTCSGAGHLDGYLIAARDLDPPEGSGPIISYFILPADAIGAVEQTWDPMGMRSTCSNGFTIDALVGTEALVGVEGVALLLAETMPEWLVASYAAVYVGVAIGAFDAAVAHARTTLATAPSDDAELHDVALSSSPWVRQRIGRAEAQVAAARLVVEDAARRVVEEPGLPDTLRAVYRAKLVAGDTAFSVASSLTEACGTASLSRGHALERILRDARSGATMPPSSDISANVLGALALGVEPGDGLGMRPW